MEKLALKTTVPAWAPVRTNSISSQIVTQVREALFSGKLKSGDWLGSEKDLATQFDVSRITVRDALRALETMGIVEIRVGASGGARIAKGNLGYFSDALAIQFKLSGVSEYEILDLQMAIESSAIELAATNRTDQDLEKMSYLLKDSEIALDSPTEFTEIGHKFHLAMVEASGNRALIAQFGSLRHVIWPDGAKRAKREIAEHAHKVHQKLFTFIKEKDAESARKLMVAHLASIRAVAFPDDRKTSESGVVCC